MKIHLYKPENRQEWDALVKSSRNGTFILMRDYIEYHGDRFHEVSLMARDERGRVAGVFPAVIQGNKVVSHAGLTYGGWIVDDSSDTAAVGMLALMELSTEYFRELGASTLIYKPVPSIYHRYPCEEDLYSLWRMGATVEARSISTVINLVSPLPMNRSSRTHANRCRREGLIARESSRWAEFWTILTLRLEERYATQPVHSLAEITMLHDRFPYEITLWTVETADGKILAGMVLYLCRDVVKVQYIASTPTGREANAIDFLTSELCEYFRDEGYQHLDLGPSCEDGGRYLNEGLITQKTRYGGRGIVYDTYELKL
ncbi:MAG: GNAT family N-acetyltransferase [Muribaculaceae bacterium]|nr:GNAT family N-acetyltransferase [Muribaculaceae bacterium]